MNVFTSKLTARHERPQWESPACVKRCTILMMTAAATTATG